MRWSPRTASDPTGVPTPNGDRKLELYEFDGCPYCAHVHGALRSMPDLEVQRHNVHRDRAAAERLRSLTGRTQVPCLVIDGQPLLESEDIVQWLKAHHHWRERSRRAWHP